MKTWKQGIVGIIATIAVVAIMIFAACATGGTSAVNTVPLDQAVQEAAKDIEDNVQAGQKIAVPDGFARVEGGKFQMGGDSGRDDEKPVHTVTITGFYMGKYEVTQKEWTAVMGDKPNFFNGDNLPVENVNWYEAVEYCNRLSQRERLTPAYTINETDITWNRNANGYRLPTEAEWEYAAKGGNGSPGNYTYSGSDNADEVAWHNRNSGSMTHDVGTKNPNGLGLYDMSGNVLEWCWDWYGDYSSGTQTDPIGASSGSRRVFRGGDWDRSAQDVRSRGSVIPYYKGNFYGIGFRLARNAP